LANRGSSGSQGSRVVSERGFELMTTPHIKADALGPSVSYGYGLMIDALDGHKVVRHTGGMVSFASATQIDVDEGVGVFVSINAMQGYRPNPVAQYALSLVRAVNAKKPLGPPPAIVLPATIADAAQYAGIFTSVGGNKLEFVADGSSLFVLRGDKRVRVESAGGQLVAREDQELGRFALNFQRASGPESPVTDLIHGG